MPFQKTATGLAARRSLSFGALHSSEYASRIIYAVEHGALPEQLAALNRTNINVQLLTIEAARTRKKEAVYQAAFLDPHTASELTLDEITALCDDLLAARGDWLPQYR